MIKLCLEGDYCQECPSFECECESVDFYISVKDFYIKCANREKCRRIHDFVLLLKQTEENDG